MRRSYVLPGIDADTVNDVALTDDGREVALSLFDDLGPRIASFQLDWVPWRKPDIVLSGGNRAEIDLAGDGSSVAAISADGLWLAREGDSTAHKLMDAAGFDAKLRYSPDGKLLASTTAASGEAQVWDTATGAAAQAPITTDATITGLALSPDGRELAITPFVSPTIFVDIATGDARPSRLRTVNSIGYSPDGTTIAGALGRSVILWDRKTDAQAGETVMPDAGVRDSLTFSGDGTLLGGIGTETIALWDLPHGYAAGPPLGVWWSPQDFAISADKTTLTAVSFGGRITVWDIDEAVHLRGAALKAAACDRLLPGRLSRLTQTEIRAAPVLDATSDADACGRK